MQEEIIACFECKPWVLEEKKALSNVFILGAQCVEFASTIQWLGEMTGVLFYCRIFPNISGNSDGSGQKACLCTTTSGCKRLTNGSVKKQSHEKQLICGWLKDFVIKEIASPLPCCYRVQYVKSATSKLNSSAECLSVCHWFPRCREMPYNYTG